jgi:hypothetical protein
MLQIGGKINDWIIFPGNCLNHLSPGLTDGHLDFRGNFDFHAHNQWIVQRIPGTAVQGVSTFDGGENRDHRGTAFVFF